MFVRVHRRGSRVYRSLVENFWDKEKKQSRQRTVRWLGRSPEAEVAARQAIAPELNRSEEKQFLTNALVEKHRPILLYGDEGVGKSWLAKEMVEELRDRNLEAHYLRWASPAGDFIKGLARLLDIDCEQEDPETGKTKKLSQSQLLDLIGHELKESPKICLILDKAHDIPKSVRNHFEHWLEDGVRMLLVATKPKRGNVYLRASRVELRPFDQAASREIARIFAKEKGIKLSDRAVEEIAKSSGGNALAIRQMVIDCELQIVSEPDQLSKRWVSAGPLIVVILAAIIIVRAVGMGLGDKNLKAIGLASVALISVARTINSETSKSRNFIE
jgi:hypothetical protein